MLKERFSKAIDEQLGAENTHFKAKNIKKDCCNWETGYFKAKNKCFSSKNEFFSLKIR
jgi:hypothetical protein